MTTKQAAGQDRATTPRGHKQTASLGQNYPNPFNPDTRIPFSIVGCEGREARRIVSLRIYNVLAQLVAVPRLEVSTGPRLALQRVAMACGDYSAYWDGRVILSGRSAASGVYLIELVVDGNRYTRKAVVSR
ncbi:MAG: hypothetical protein ABJA80_03605 [bacterium]